MYLFIFVCLSRVLWFKKQDKKTLEVVDGKGKLRWMLKLAWLGRIGLQKLSSWGATINSLIASLLPHHLPY